LRDAELSSRASFGAADRSGLQAVRVAAFGAIACAMHSFRVKGFIGKWPRGC